VSPHRSLARSGWIAGDDCTGRNVLRRWHDFGKRLVHPIDYPESERKFAVRLQWFQRDLADASLQASERRPPRLSRSGYIADSDAATAKNGLSISGFPARRSGRNRRSYWLTDVSWNSSTSRCDECG